MPTDRWNAWANWLVRKPYIAASSVRKTPLASVISITSFGRGSCHLDNPPAFDVAPIAAFWMSVARSSCLGGLSALEAKLRHHKPFDERIITRHT
jgi:hypothetical protein